MAYGYNNDDQLTTVTDFNSKQIAITPNADGLPATVSLGATGDSVSTNYDNGDAPSVITLKNSSATLQSFTYSNSPAGTILSETDTPSSALSPANYAYDAKGRVTSDTPGTGSADSYSFDASGNLTALPTGAAGTYDHAGELTSQAVSGTTTTYAYNADGQQLTGVRGSTTASTATWSGAGQLATYSNAAANMSAAAYDGNGLRASTTITPSGGSAVNQGYVWNAQPRIPQLLMDGVNAYIYTTATEPAEQVNLTTGTITYLVADLLGSIRGTVSTTGALTATTSYDAWGNPETTGGLTSATPFGYAGGYTDPPGLVYLINRYYSPQLGQFISVDPDLAATLQPYAYAGDNPVSHTDPTGLYEGVEYKPVCGIAGCVNIVKFCKDNTLKNCALYWNTQPVGIYRAARNASLHVNIQVQHRTVSDYQYSHTKDAAAPPFFHGDWGIRYPGGQTHPLGTYSYPCYVFATCTGYLKGSDDVEFAGYGWWYRNGSKFYTITGTWGVNTGKVGRWRGGNESWAGLPYK